MRNHQLWSKVCHPDENTWQRDWLELINIRKVTKKNERNIFKSWFFTSASIFGVSHYLGYWRFFWIYCHVYSHTDCFIFLCNHFHLFVFRFELFSTNCVIRSNVSVNTFCEAKKNESDRRNLLRQKQQMVDQKKCRLPLECKMNFHLWYTLHHIHHYKLNWVNRNWPGVVWSRTVQELFVFVKSCSCLRSCRLPVSSAMQLSHDLH